MKKLAVLCFLFVLVAVPKAFGADNISEKNLQNVVNQTGFKILNANEIERRMIFRIEKSYCLKGRIDSKRKIIYIPTGIFTQTETDDETAAVIALQIARCIRTYEENKADYTEKISPEKYQTYTDKRAVDLLVKSDYSPLALISYINKVYGVDGVKTKKDNTSVRLAKIYEYISRKYPQKLDDKAFKENIYYQNFLLNSRYNRNLLQNRMQHNPYSAEQIEYR